MFLTFCFQIPGSHLLLLCAEVQIVLVTLRPAFSRSIPGCFPQSSLYLYSIRTSCFLLPHRRKTNGSPVPRTPPLPNYFCPYFTSICNPTSHICPQTSCYWQGRQTCTPLDMFSLLPSPASVVSELSFKLYHCNSWIGLLQN